MPLRALPKQKRRRGHSRPAVRSGGGLFSRRPLAARPPLLGPWCGCRSGLRTSRTLLTAKFSRDGSYCLCRPPLFRSKLNELIGCSSHRCQPSDPTRAEQSFSNDGQCGSSEALNQSAAPVLALRRVGSSVSFAQGRARAHAVSATGKPLRRRASPCAEPTGLSVRPSRHRLRNTVSANPSHCALARGIEAYASTLFMCDSSHTCVMLVTSML